MNAPAGEGGRGSGGSQLSTTPSSAPHLPLQADAAARRHCICPPCVARTVHAARVHINFGRADPATDILELLARDSPHLAPCLADEDLPSRVHQLQIQVREYCGWTRAYQDQERQRLVLGPRCRCLWEGRQR